MSKVTDLAALREPVEDPQRAKRVPAARLALAVLHLEVALAPEDVLERPAAVGIPIARDGLVGLVAGVAQVVEPAQDVVEVPVRERELEPAGVDHFAGALPAEQPTL